MQERCERWASNIFDDFQFASGVTFFVLGLLWVRLRCTLGPAHFHPSPSLPLCGPFICFAAFRRA